MVFFQDYMTKVLTEHHAHDSKFYHAHSVHNSLAVGTKVGEVCIGVGEVSISVGDGVKM